MRLLKETLVANTTKQERELNVRNAFGLGSIDSLLPSERLNELAQAYINGEMEICEIYEIRKKELLKQE
ncbi:hypothetical protein [Pectinatus haikarae]|uniref:Antitoxin VbhA domain-containing protein n=1 Tax=Pectinatus haikarae TaxID=349096 RepID=A0ABT9Y4X1_9FIRM|nr:hypothetical protein [Pectinatus haikarae]MDQ0202879.1 hypothetical protein [Pectinatus haikarae]